MDTAFAKIIELMKLTGDNYIILDVQGNPSFMITTFEKYENLVKKRGSVAGPHKGKTSELSKNQTSEAHDVPAQQGYQFEPLD